MLHFACFVTDFPEGNLFRKRTEPGTLSEHILVEEQDVRISVDVILKYSQSESISHIRFDQSLLHHMENAPDEPCRRLIGLQRKPVIHPMLKVPEETHIKVLENVTGVRRESDYFHSVICERL
jgi:hypothetical protein